MSTTEDWHAGKVQGAKGVEGVRLGKVGGETSKAGDEDDPNEES